MTWSEHSRASSAHNVDIAKWTLFQNDDDDALRRSVIFVIKPELMSQLISLSLLTKRIIINFSPPSRHDNGVEKKEK